MEDEDVEDDDVKREEEDDVENDRCGGGGRKMMILRRRRPITRPRRTVCASLRSRKACQDFTRATLYGNLQVKCRAPE